MLADIRKQADAIVLSQFSPNGVVVNSSMEILQFRGVTAQYLEHAPGEATLSLLKMARQGLAVLDGFVDEMKAAGAWPPGCGARCAGDGSG